MRCCKSIRRETAVPTASDPPSQPQRPARRRVLGHLLSLPLLLSVRAARASSASIRYAEIVSAYDGYVVNADIEMELNPRLIDALLRGVSLHFVAEFVIELPRWYWFNASIVERTLAYRLSYHAITRNYRLSIGTLHQNFETLEAALNTMLRIRNWRIVEPGRLQDGVSYNAALRFRHDLSMLPKPFQVTAFGSSDWSLSTDWMNWTFLAGAVR